MRIISGKYKGRIIRPPSNLPVRPTTDFAKTGLFNIIHNIIDLTECNCLDLFSGTGGITLEMISRGSKNVTAVDRDFGCINFLKATALKLGISNLIVFKTDIFIFLKKNTNKFDIIFADPPFQSTFKEDLTNLIFEKNLLTEKGVFILEHSTDEKMDHLPHFSYSRSYGNVNFSFFFNFELSADKK